MSRRGFLEAASAVAFAAGASTSRSPVNLDAEATVKVSFAEAFRGGERTLSVNDERVQVRIPAGVKNRSRLRLKGKGNHQPGTGRRGDLYLNLEVQITSGVAPRG